MLFSEESTSRRMRLLIQWSLFGRRSVQSPFFHSPPPSRKCFDLR